MRTILLSSVAGAALLAGDGLAAAPMETSPGQGQGIIVAMGEGGQTATPETRRVLQERRSVASVNLTSDQKTRLHDIVTTGNLHRANDANFAHSVGAQVPGSVRIYGVPQSIVDIVPQYRGFDYIIVGNDLLIVDPSTLQIVYI